MTICSSILAWRIPWTEEPGGLRSVGSQRVRHDWSDWAPTPGLRIWQKGNWRREGSKVNFHFINWTGLKEFIRLLFIGYLVGAGLRWSQGRWGPGQAGQSSSPPRHTHSQFLKGRAISPLGTRGLLLHIKRKSQEALTEIMLITLYFQFSSVAQSCPTLCDLMNRSTPGLQLSEFTQAHVHRVGDAIQPSHPLSSSSPPAPNPSQHQGLFQWVSSSHQVAKVLEFQLQHQSFQWIFRTDFL